MDPGVNLGRLAKKANAYSVGDRKYMHLQSDIVQTEVQTTQNSTGSATGTT